MNRRVRKVISTFDKNKIDAFLVLKEINVRYLTEFPAEESFLLVCKKKAYYITDARYDQEVKTHLKGIKVCCYKKSPWEEIAKIARAEKVKTLGLNESHITVAQYKTLKVQLSSKIKLRGISQYIESFRMIKDASEIDLMRKALTIHKKAQGYLKRIIKPNRSEKEIAGKLEAFIRSHGVNFSFPPIIASGVHSSFPHAKITHQKIRSNDVVLVDMGIDYKGYKSDLTRVFFLGRIPKSIREIYASVSGAQQAAVQEMRAGMKACEVDKIARDYLKERGVSRYFLHSLGHGVGLEVHEMPRLSSLSQDTLEEGMVVTVEPGVYLSNKFGIRLEEMVLITKKGCELLSDNIN